MVYLFANLVGILEALIIEKRWILYDSGNFYLATSDEYCWRFPIKSNKHPGQSVFIARFFTISNFSIISNVLALFELFYFKKKTSYFKYVPVTRYYPRISSWWNLSISNELALFELFLSLKKHLNIWNYLLLAGEMPALTELW